MGEKTPTRFFYYDCTMLVISKAPGSLSYRELGEEAGVNRDTVRSYVLVLSEIKILLEIPFSQWGKEVVPEKNRKFAIRDPLMAGIRRVESC